MKSQRSGPQRAQVPLVFVIDDDADMASVVRDAARGCGWSAHSFTSPYAILEALERCQPYCIVSDLRMPAMGGIELRKTLLMRACAIPFVLMTGHLEDRSRKNAERTGISAALIKPFNVEQLKAAVARAVQANTDSGMRLPYPPGQEIMTWGLRLSSECWEG